MILNKKAKKFASRKGNCWRLFIDNFYCETTEWQINFLLKNSIESLICKFCCWEPRNESLHILTFIVVSVFIGNFHENTFRFQYFSNKKTCLQGNFSAVFFLKFNIEKVWKKRFHRNGQSIKENFKFTWVSLVEFEGNDDNFYFIFPSSTIVNNLMCHLKKYYVNLI